MGESKRMGGPKLRRDHNRTLIGADDRSAGVVRPPARGARNRELSSTKQVDEVQCTAQFAWRSGHNRVCVKGMQATDSHGELEKLGRSGNVPGRRSPPSNRSADGRRGTQMNLHGDNRCRRRRDCLPGVVCTGGRRTFDEAAPLALELPERRAEVRGQRVGRGGICVNLRKSADDPSAFHRSADGRRGTQMNGDARCRRRRDCLPGVVSAGGRRTFDEAAPLALELPERRAEVRGQRVGRGGICANLRKSADDPRLSIDPQMDAEERR